MYLSLLAENYILKTCSKLTKKGVSIFSVNYGQLFVPKERDKRVNGSVNIILHLIFRFVSVEEKKRLGTIKENEVLVQRKKEILLNGQMQNVTVPFRIVDQPLKLKQNEWSVAFFMAVVPTQPAFVCSKLKIETLEQL